MGAIATHADVNIKPGKPGMPAHWTARLEKDAALSPEPHEQKPYKASVVRSPCYHPVFIRGCPTLTGAST